MNENDMTEEEFLRNYDPSKWPRMELTVDLAVFTIRNNALSILLIERGGHPFKGQWALPGGFAEPNETLDESALRELMEETNLAVDGKYIEQLKTYGSPDRDPRGYITSVAYVSLIPEAGQVTAGSDAHRARYFAVEDALAMDLAFDHKQIITDGLERVRAKLEYSPVAHHFLADKEFTISDLRKVYEIVWGTELTPSNFRRKILSVPDFVVPVGKNEEVGGPKPAALYRAGGAKVIYPPLPRG